VQTFHEPGRHLNLSLKMDRDDGNFSYLYAPRFGYLIEGPN